MLNLIRSEILKLRTTRTFFGIVIGCLALVGLICFGVAGFVPLADLDGGVVDTDVIAFAGFASIFALVLGVLAVSTEFRHGTITPSLLVAPSRSQLLVAKLVSHVVIGMLLAVASLALAIAIFAVAGALRGYDTDFFGGTGMAVIVGTIIATGLYAALGVGIGAILRNQVGAIMAALGYFLFVEGLLGLIPTVGDWIADYGPGAAGDVLSNSTAFAAGDSPLTQVEAGLVMTGYAVVLVVAGFLVFRRRDVSA